MSNNFTLDDIRNAAEAKYGSTIIELGDGESVTLLNPLRLKKDKREALLALQTTLGSEDADVDQFEAMSEMVRLVAKDAAPAEHLLAALDGDLALLAQVIDTYVSGTQVGEASASAA